MDFYYDNLTKVLYYSIRDDDWRYGYAVHNLLVDKITSEHFNLTEYMHIISQVTDLPYDDIINELDWHAID